MLLRSKSTLCLLAGLWLVNYTTVSGYSSPLGGIEQSPRPNIIYILADDLGYGDLSLLGQTSFATPNIDRLAKQGMLFINHYSGSAVCASSRATLMTGQHTGHTAVRGNQAFPGVRVAPLSADPITLPEAIKVNYVGQPMDELNKLKIAENTVVIFTSDNGAHNEGGHAYDYFNSNGPFREYKRSFYEGGLPAPIIVRWPAVVKPGSTTNHLSAFWDVMPTLCEIAGAPMPESTDGISFLPTLLGEEQLEHKIL